MPLTYFRFLVPIKTPGGATEEKYQKSITVNNHSPLHEVLVDETAAFATVDATNLFFIFKFP